MTKSPFRYFKTSPEIIRLAVMMYVRFPLSLRNVEDLLHERGINICHETIRYWWNRFGPMFAAEIRKRRGLSEENGFSRIIDTITVGSMKNQNPFRYFKTSPEIIRLAVMMYVRFPLSLRNVEDLLHERGIDICHETVRYWWNRFGPMFASEIRRTRVSRLECYSNWQWHIDEVFVRINGEQHYLWRAVDHEGEVLETYVTKRRDKAAALAFLKKAMKRYGEPKVIVTDRLASYKAALREINSSQKQEVGRWMNNRAENSHLPFRRRERAMQRFRRMRSLQKFVALHSSVYNLFNHERHLTKRNDFKDQRQAALSEWQQLCAA